MTPPRDIADEPDWEEIVTLHQFRERVSGQYGVIVIQDATRAQPIVHHRACPFVDEEFFVEKVVDSAGRNGRYYWAKNSGIAATQLDAVRCKQPGDELSR